MSFFDTSPAGYKFAQDQVAKQMRALGFVQDPATGAWLSPADVLNNAAREAAAARVATPTDLPPRGVITHGDYFPPLPVEPPAVFPRAPGSVLDLPAPGSTVIVQTGKEAVPAPDPLPQSVVASGSPPDSSWFNPDEKSTDSNPDAQPGESASGEAGFDWSWRDNDQKYAPGEPEIYTQRLYKKWGKGKRTAHRKTQNRKAKAGQAARLKKAPGRASPSKRATNSGKVAGVKKIARRKASAKQKTARK